VVTMSILEFVISMSSIVVFRKVSVVPKNMNAGGMDMNYDETVSANEVNSYPRKAD